MRQYSRSSQSRSNTGRSDNKRQDSPREGNRSAPRSNNGQGRPNGHGNPRELHQKYLALAREAAQIGDVVEAEQHLQHAEHYYRVAAERAAHYNSQPQEPRQAPAIPEPVVQSLPEMMAPPIQVDTNQTVTFPPV